MDDTPQTTAAHRVWHSPEILDQICASAAPGTVARIARTAKVFFKVAAPYIWCRIGHVDVYEERLERVVDPVSLRCAQPTQVSSADMENGY